MNTKQLWNALTLNPVTNNNFDGIFSIDTLKEIKEKPTLIVCNTDSLAHEITYYGSEFIYFVERFAYNFKYTVR